MEARNPLTYACIATRRPEDTAMQLDPSRPRIAPAPFTYGAKRAVPPTPLHCPDQLGEGHSDPTRVGGHAVLLYGVVAVMAAI